MRLYPQFILWTYILLPAICLFLTSAFLSGLVKAQQLKVKMLSNALNAKARTAAAFARNHAKTQQFRNGEFSNNIGKKNGFKLRSKREVEEMGPLERTHWDQQEESMNQLQNMWNMNMNNMMNDGVLREADPHKKKKHKHGKKFRSSQQIDNQQEFETLGSPRIYDDKRKYGDGPESFTGSFFGRNVYDDVLTRANQPMEDEFMESARSHKKKFKKYKKKGHDYTYYSGNYYRNAEAPIMMENAPHEMIMHDPNLMSVHVQPIQMQDLQFEPHDDHMDAMLREQGPDIFFDPNFMGNNLDLPHDHLPTAFRRNNENEEIMPQEFMLMGPPEDLMQQEARSSANSPELRKNPDILRSLPDSYDTGYGNSYDTSYGSSYGSYDSSYGKPSKKDKKLDLLFKKLDKKDKKDKDKDDGYGYGDYNYDYDYGKAKLKVDPLKLYEKAVRELAEIKHKIVESEKNLLIPDKIYKKTKKIPQTPVAHFIDDYGGYNDGYGDGGYSGGYLDNPSNGGYIGGADVYKEAKEAKEAKSANPDPSLSHTITHSHTFTHHSDLDLPKKHLFKKLPPKPHDYFNKAEAHSKALHFKHGGYSQADSKSIAHGAKPQLFEASQGYGQSVSQHAAAQAAAQANSVNHYNNGGLSHQAAAQANSGNQYNNGAFGQVQSGNQNHNGGFGQAQAAAQTHSSNGQSIAQSAAKVNPGGLAQSAAQSNSGFGPANAQAASQIFDNGGFANPQALAQATSGPQFFQVLAPSNFVNARSNDESQPRQDGGFVMPHLREIPIADTFHGIMDESSRFPRSHGIVDSSLAINQPEDGKTAGDIVDSSLKTDTFKNKRHSVDNIFGGLNLARGIVRASFDNPLVNQHKRPKNDGENAQAAMNLASGIVDSSLKFGNDAGSSNIADQQQAPSAQDMTFQGISSISDIVHRSMRHKRQIFEGNNPCPVIPQPNNDETIRSATEENIPNQETTTTTEPIVALPPKIDPDDIKDFTNKNQQQKNLEKSKNWDNEPTNFDDEMIQMINYDDPEFSTTNAPPVDDPEFSTTNAPPVEEDTEAIKEWGRDEDRTNPPLIDDLKVIVHPKKDDEGFYEELENQQKVENVTEVSISSSTDGNIGNSSSEAPTEASSSKQDESTNTEQQIIDKVVALIEPNKNISALTPEEIEEIQFSIPDVTEGKHLMESNQQDSEILGSPHKPSENATTDPLASIEKEMSTLTEEEQEAFIKQEMALIADFIEEALHREPIPHKGEHQEVSTTEKSEEPKIQKPEEPEIEKPGEHHEVTEIREPEAGAKIDIDLLHQPTEKVDQASVAPLPHPQDSASTVKPEILSSPHLFQAFERDIGREPYERHARAASPIDQTFDEIVGAHREKLQEIHNKAYQDDDLLLISFIGQGIINDLENSRREVEEKARSAHGNRLKRKIANLNPNYYPIKQLVKDHRTKIDIPKTLENIGTVVRYTLEDPRAPMYHVRSLLGNTKNTVMAAAKVPPNNILLPAQYEVTRLTEDVGAINPTMLNSRTGFDNNEADPYGIMNTFQQIGGVVQGSVNSGKDVVRHANDVASDVKQVIYTTKTSAPLIMLPSKIPVITSRFAETPPAIIVAPRVLDLVGTAQEPPPRQFVGMGNILDAIGVSKPNQPDFETQRIIWEPSERSQNFLGAEEEKMQKPDLKQFFNKMHQEMKEIITAQHEERKRKLQETNFKKDREFAKKKSARSTQVPRKNPQINYDRIIDEHRDVTLPPEILGIFSQNNPVASQNNQVGANLQPELKNPCMGQPSGDEFSENMRLNGNEPHLKRKTEDVSTRQVLSQNPVTIKSRFQDIDENYQVGLNLQPELMKPFMGQPSEDEVSEFMRENGDEEGLERKNDDVSRRQSQPVLSQNPVTIKSRFQDIDENYRVGLNLQSDLMKPFMGQPSEDEFSEFMRENGDEEVVEKKNEDVSRRQSQPPNPVTIKSGVPEFDKNTGNIQHSEDKFNEFWRTNAEAQKNNRKLMVYPIFPLNFNITIPAGGELKPINLKDFLPFQPLAEEDMMVGQKNPQDTNNREETNSTGRISMTIDEGLQNPFLGILGHDKVHKFLNKYDNSDYYPQENYYNPVKNVVYSDNYDDYNMW